MLFLFLSVICSVLVSVELKVAPRLGVHVAQAVAWNYLAASLLAAGLLHPSLHPLRQAEAPAWITMGLLAVLLPGIFLVMARSVRAAGIVRSDVAQRLSLLVSLFAAFALFGESASVRKLLGLALGLAAAVCIVMRPSRPEAGGGPSGIGAWLLPLGVFSGYGAIDVLLKRLAMGGVPAAAALCAIFPAAMAFMLCAAIVCGGFRPGKRLRSFLFGLLLGTTNFGNILFYIRAHQALPESPAVVFATMNIGVVVAGTLVGVLGFRERLGRLNQAGVAAAVVAILILAWH